MKTLTGVRATLCAAHRSRDGHLHGHTWEIIAWWADCPDAVEKQAALTNYLRVFDHQVLADGVAWGESLGASILKGLDCVKVEVRRPLEGIFAEVAA